MQYGHITFQTKVKNNGLIKKQMTTNTHTFTMWPNEVGVGPC
jgi:hypothetical protein